MPAKNKQFSVYPDPTALAIVGGNCPACNRAIHCWAAILRRAEPEVKLDRAEWNFLADVLNGTYLLDEGIRGEQFWTLSTLSVEIHDAQRLNGTGDKWFAQELKRGSGDRAVKRLIAKIEKLTWEQVQYVLTAVLYFWEDASADGGRIDHQADEWWTLAHRVRKAD